MVQHQMLGNLISAGASLLGGLIGKSSADDARDAANAHSLRQEALQREFAQNGIQWKVQDALKAGIHPIYALGSAGASFSPVSQNFSADTSLPNALAAAGQDIGRGIHATRTQSQRMDALGKTAAALQLEGLGLDNDLKRAEIASKTGRLRQGQVGPPMADPAANYLIPGQGDTQQVKAKPLEVAPGNPTRAHMEGGAITDVGVSRTNDGWAPVPSKDVKERIEDNIFQEALHFYRNNVLPSLGQNLSPPYEAPKGKEWWFNTIRQEYQLFDEGKRPTMGHRARR